MFVNKYIHKEKTAKKKAGGKVRKAADAQGDGALYEKGGMEGEIKQLECSSKLGRRCLVTNTEYTCGSCYYK